MSRTTFEQLRVPAALVLLLVAGFIFWPRGGDASPTATTATPSATVIVGEPGGEVISSSTATPAASAVPSVTPAPTATPPPTPTPNPTATPRVASGFGAEVLACRSISGSRCNRQLGTLPANAGKFTALVRFTDAVAGDAINVVLTGPAGTITGGPYTLRGGGDGYYYSTFSAGGLPGGEYTLTAFRNGAEVAVTRFRRAGG